RPVLDSGQLEHAEHAEAALRRDEVGCREGGLTEERVGPLALEADDLAQYHAGRRSGDATDALELRLALVGRQVGDHRLQVLEVQQSETLGVRPVEDEREAR